VGAGPSLAGSIWQPGSSWTDWNPRGGLRHTGWPPVAASGHPVFDFDGQRMATHGRRVGRVFGFRRCVGALDAGACSCWKRKGFCITTDRHGARWNFLIHTGDEPGPSLIDMWGSSASDIFAVGGGWYGPPLQRHRLDFRQTASGVSKRCGEYRKSRSTQSTTWRADLTGGMARPLHGTLRAPFSHGTERVGVKRHSPEIADRRPLGTNRNRSSPSVVLKYVATEVSPGVWVGGWEFYRHDSPLRSGGLQSMIEKTTSGQLYDVWGSRRAMSSPWVRGEPLHYGRVGLAEWRRGRSRTLRGVGSSTDDVFAAGANGIVLLRRANMGSDDERDDEDDTRMSWGGSANGRVRPLVTEERILHFDASSWQAMASPTGDVCLRSGSRPPMMFSPSGSTGRSALGSH